MKTILLIHTGGTISMQVHAETGAVVPADQNPLLIEAEKLRSLANIVEIDAFNLPSPHITPIEMMELKQLIDQYILSDNIDGVVITHGTDTLEETAYFLDLTVDTDIPIVLTGAMRSSNEIGADGLYNLLSAIQVASSDDAKMKGVLVVLNDEIHTAENVTKTHASNVSTFQSPQYGPIGFISKSIVHFHHSPNHRLVFPIEHIDKKVALFKVYAGMEPDLLQASIDLGYDGIVLEGLGQGNVPPRLVSVIEETLNKGIPIVLVSRCFNGIAQDVYGYKGGGKGLKDAGVIFAQGLNGQKARLALLIALNHPDPLKAIEYIF
ncbi:L-asparaginase [Psychrobacillus psychrotolerans]|uniref:asparaginase n=1 Tax=Psychrobacillus psychrotolerans TaxID=126156 RepID=A0A1I5VXX6_9BACI|nr:asparaginase [Psychrobacillus psychrotolerans]SFQ12352.1 L-asparaginase [Psychrobacillus psychrotolerans]